MKNRLKIISAFVISILFASFVYLVFQGKFILPQTISFGWFSVHYYGVIMALAIASSFFYAIKNLPDFFSNKQQAEDFLFWLIVGGFVGARLYHVFSSYAYYLNKPIEIFYIWHGGLSIYGAIFGGLVTTFIYTKITKFKYSALGILNWLTVPLLIGQIIGRLGNFFNYELYGYPTKLPWGMFVPEQFRQLEYLSFRFFHPIFLYEIILNCLILLAFFKIKYNKKYLFFYYILWYNLGRFFIEFLRIDSSIFKQFRVNSVLSLILVIVAFGLIFFSDSKHDTKIP